MQVGRVRVDVVALLGGRLTAIELKSAKDTLTRLGDQYAACERLFPQVVVAAAARHVEGVQAIVGPRCGIWVAEEAPGGVHLRVRSRRAGTRAPKPRSKAKPARLAHYLRRSELLAILGLPPEAALRKPAAAQRVLAAHPGPELEALVFAALRARKLAGDSPKPHLTSAGMPATTTGDTPCG